MREPGGWWQRKSTPAKVETYTRWSFHFFAVIEVVSLGLPILGGIPGWLAGLLLVLVVGHAVACAVTASRALDWTRGRREQPVHTLWTLGAVTAAVSVTAIVIAEHGPGGDAVDSATGGIFSVVLIFGAGVFAMGVRDRRRVYGLVAGFAVGSGVVAFPLGLPGAATLLTMLAVLLGAGFLAFTSAFSVWLLNAVYELDEARETRARLAVAEERLRFGRDLHDVMGRNLAVIALKSELAVQLTRRGRPEAEEQMVEVQRIARESQREVRDVVRGYREADLGVELAGAQGVLQAAGIHCTFAADGEATAGLAADVQSALAWVVREATTNVLRHGDAGWCVVSVRVSDGRVVLSVENDGVGAGAGSRGGGPGGGGSRAEGFGVEGSGAEGSGAEGSGAEGFGVGGFGVGGSGLVGLRERLAAVEGTLEAGPVGEGVFRVVASVPLRVREVTG
ncbi:histidine kinase [Streptomyces sp. S.PB5]|uniref:sensor histidine kinase n=1 Tax=Streptomyces sp. S.PB5 TaxID=3020844 RepID=UPI0025AF0443|nr:histidine kinase [Streptomyces sp. S.PB5]MDN3023890.1 histidine kinase [Streptomyces sp. S.PB5]